MLAKDYLRKSECSGSGFSKTRPGTRRLFRTKRASAFAKASDFVPKGLRTDKSAGQEFIRKCVRISIKSADFRIKRASSCFETVEPFDKLRAGTLKTFENIRKLI